MPLGTRIASWPMCGPSEQTHNCTHAEAHASRPAASEPDSSWPPNEMARRVWSGRKERESERERERAGKSMKRCSGNNKTRQIVGRKKFASLLKKAADFLFARPPARLLDPKQGSANAVASQCRASRARLLMGKYLPHESLIHWPSLFALWRKASARRRPSQGWSGLCRANSLARTLFRPHQPSPQADTWEVRV